MHYRALKMGRQGVICGGILALLSGCTQTSSFSTQVKGESFSIFDIQSQEQSITIPANQRPTTLFFVIDNSGSMADDQSRLEQNMSQFVQSLTESGSFFSYLSIVATTSDAYSNVATRFKQILAPPSTQAQVLSFIPTATRPGTNGSGSERLVESLFATWTQYAGFSYADPTSSIDPAQNLILVQPNPNFPSAANTVVTTFVTDEVLQTSTGATADLAYSQLAAKKTKSFVDAAFAQSPNAAASHESYFNVVYNQNTPSQATGWANYSDELNTLYGKQVSAPFDIAAADWGSALIDRLQDLVVNQSSTQTQVVKTLTLSFPAIPDTLEVKITTSSGDLILVKNKDFLLQPDGKTILLLNSTELNWDTLAASGKVSNESKIIANYNPASLAQ